MPTIFAQPSFQETKRNLICTEAEALRNLEQVANWMVNNARWTGLMPSKVNQLRKPLIQLRIARRTRNQSC